MKGRLRSWMVLTAVGTATALSIAWAGQVPVVSQHAAAGPAGYAADTRPDLGPDIVPGLTLFAGGRQEQVRLLPAAEGNEARYVVREQLANISFPSDAIGRTSNITGVLVLEADGRVAAEGSRFVVDLASIASDNDRRDNYIRRNTLRTAQNPSAIFVPTAVRGLASPLPGEAETSFQLLGDLTVNGVTKPVSWEVTARSAGAGVRGTAVTEFTFATFEMTIPRVASVLSVRDNIRLEYDFHLVPGGAQD